MRLLRRMKYSTWIWWSSIFAMIVGYAVLAWLALCLAVWFIGGVVNLIGWIMGV